jgi:hypothetical protein
VGEGRARAAALERAAERDVVVGTQAHPLVAADPAIDGGAHEVARAHPDGLAGVGVFHPPRPHVQQEGEEEVVDDEGEWPGAQLETGARRDEVRPARLGEPDEPRQRIGREHHVGVGEQDPLAARALGAARERVRLPQPPVGQRVDAHHAHPRVAGRGPAGDVAGAVGGAVVDDDDLDRGARRGPAERAQRGEPRGDGVRLVARRDDHRHEGRAVGAGGQRLPGRVGERGHAPGAEGELGELGEGRGGGEGAEGERGADGRGTVSGGGRGGAGGGNGPRRAPPARAARPPTPRRGRRS